MTRIVVEYHGRKYFKTSGMWHSSLGERKVEMDAILDKELPDLRSKMPRNIMPCELNGNWVKGLAYDLHTLSSEYLGQNEFGHDQYNTTRSEMGEFVYQLKYKHDEAMVVKIIDLLENKIIPQKIDFLIPIPPSNLNREHQPVFSIASEFGSRFNIKVYLNALEKNSESQELKNIDDPKERQEALKNSMEIRKNHYLEGKNILIIDDLYRSGSTLKVATELLYKKAKAENVYVLTMTKTRSKR